MGNRGETQLNTMLRRVKRRRWQALLMLCLAILVTAGVAGIFHHTGIAKTYRVTALTCSAVPPEGPACANFFVHIHNDDCYDAEGRLVCPLPEIRPHRHTSDCYITSRELVCGIPESDGHQHTADCYTRVKGELICELSTEPVLDEAGNVLEEGHVHTDECYAWTEELTCGMEQGEGAHHHDDSCYETYTTLTCDQPEILLHTHTEACYQKNEDGSLYVDENGNTWLICGQLQVLEHVHGPECFTTYELDDGEPEFVFMEEEAKPAESESQETEPADAGAENTEGDESGFVFLFPEEDEEAEAETADAEDVNTEGEEISAEAQETDPQTAETEDGDVETESNDTEEADPADSTEPSADEENPEAAADGEDATDETAVTEEPHTVVYTGTRRAEKGGVTVLAEIPEGALDENAILSLTDVEDNAVEKLILKAVNGNAAEGEEREIVSMLLLDIGFVSDGEPAEPQGPDPIRVTLRAAAIRGMTAPKLFHLTDGTAREVEDVIFDTETGSAVFTSTSFSPFAVVDLTGDEIAEEPASVSMPAQSFSGETEDVVVSVTAPEGAFPEGTTMEVRTVEVDDETMSSVESAVEGRITSVQAVDITFFDADGNKIEPQTAIQVSMKSAVVSQSENVSLIHKPDAPEAADAEAEAPGLELMEAAIVEQEDTSAPSDEITFESDAFSVYMLVGTETITTNYITADGETYTITVTYGADAMIPQGATLAVTEIPQDSEEYAAFLDQAKTAVNAGAASTDAGETAEVTEVTVETAEETDGAVETASTESGSEPAGRVTVTTARFFDITILDAEGNPVEPAAPVDVKIEYAEPAETAENYQVVHFGEETEVLNPAVSGADGSASAFDFQTDSFSVFGIVGTKTIEMTYITADGETFEVTVTYGPEAGVPEGATLRVSELTQDSDDYQEYLERTAYAVGADADSLNYLKLLDISIMNGEDKVVIQAPVEVRIKLLDKENAEENGGEKTKIVHFGEEEAAVIDPDLEGITVSFEAEGFSYYAVTSYGATADLAGKSYAIVQVNTQAAQAQEAGNNTVYQGRALTTTAQYNNTRLGGATVSVETHESGLNIVTSGTTQIVEWTFEAVEGENTYYIKAPNGQYLNLSGNNALELSNTPQALTITAGTGNTAGKVRISNGDRRVRSSVSAGASRTANNNQYFYNDNSNDANYVYMTLCEIKEFDPNQYPVYSGEKISVQNLVDGQKYIIYKNIYNEMTGEYEDWVIDGNGNPVRAYDQGDSLSLHSEISPMWVLSILTNSSGQANGYYLFRNEKTGLILHPLADGTLVKEYDSETSPTTDGVSLKGREGGDYTSTIEYWDGSAMAYYGYRFTTNGQVVLSSATGSDSQAFSFAKEPESSAGLHEVATVDSAADGITIHMFNYPDRSTIANVTGSNSYGVGVIPAQHVQAKLGTDGYPVFTNNKSGSALFDPSKSYHKGTGNHLFLESIYDSTGYYEYSAFNNFAHYNSNGSFTVYQETGTPSPTSNNFYFKRGNFFPYNTLNTNNTAQNIYTGDGSLIDYENPSYGSTLYGLKETTDFYFGMTMDFHFLMPKDGYYNGSPLIYEFNGDDDLWIYIDDVLILDIGGVHDAFPGSINFVTGEITGGNGGAGGARTIKDCFKNAGVFPDGTAWDDSKVDEYFNGNTFASYGSHQFNMFYMEHGAGASNLMMRFNLPVIEKGKYTVEKKLDNTSQVDYANVSFAYQAFGKVDGNYTPMTLAVYEGRTDASGNPVPLVFYNNVVIDRKTYDNVFYLKPNEAAVFSDLPEEELYYVQEIGIKSDYYDEIFVNDVKIDGETEEAQDGVYRSSEATVQNRARVTYTNRCNNRNSNELRIKKQLAEGSTDNGDTFEFRVMLENAAGTLAAYYQGTYYIRDDNGVYYRYQNGMLVSNGQTPYACTAGNYGTIAQIPPNYTVVIKDLLAGTDFYVDEIRVRPNGTSSDVLLGDSEWTLVSTSVTECDEAQITDASIYDYATGTTVTRDALGAIAWNKDATVIFTNRLKNVDVKLKKTDDSGNLLSGSEFALQKLDKSWVELTNDIKPDAATATGNPADLGNLDIGRYRLEETHAPDGYIILTKYVYFEVYSDTDGAIKVKLTDEDGKGIDEGDPASVTLVTEEGSSYYVVAVKNTPGVVLPQTGGIGTGIFTALGAILGGTAGAILTVKTVRGRKEQQA